MDGLNSGLEQLSLSNLKEEMQKILSDQSKLKKEMQNNLSDQSKINERIKSIFTHIIQRNTFFNDNYFPLDNDDDLNYMENKISKKMNSEFKSLLVDDLIYIGGKDVKDMVKRLMTKLFTMKLLSAYTREGGSRTRKLLDLKIYNLIFNAIIKQFSDTPETVKEFKDAIDNHLKASKKSL